MSSLVSRKLNVNGVGIHCVTNGSSNDDDTPPRKPALLCMPGALGGAEADFGPQLRGLADDFQVVSYDPRGYGQSRPPRRDFPLDFYQRDADDAAAVMSELGHERYSVMGFSDGAMSAIMLAGGTTNHQSRERVEKLVVFGGSAYYTKQDTVTWLATRDVSKWPDSQKQEYIDVYGDDFAPMWAGAVDAWVALAQIHDDGNVCMDEARSITSPTLVLHGAKDPMVEMEHPEWFAANIPGDGNTKLHVFPDGAHTIQHDCADELNSVVREFLLS